MLWSCFGPQRRAWFLDPLLLEVIDGLVGHEGEALEESADENRRGVRNERVPR